MDIPTYEGQYLSLFVKLTDPSFKITAYMWGPVRRGIQRTTENIDMLISNNYVQVPREKGNHLMAQLMSQCADGYIVDTQNLWVRKEQLEWVKQYPIILGFTLGSAEYIPDGDSIPMLQFLPHPRMGEVGLVDDGQSQYFHLIQNLPQDAQDLCKKIGEALIELAAPSGWMTHNELGIPCASELGYQNLITDLRSKLLRSRKASNREDIKLSIEKLEKAHHEVVLLRQSWLKVDWLVRWGEIRTMAQELAREYYEFHQKLKNEHGMRDMPPVSLGVFNERLLVATNQPFLTTMEAIQNAASGANRWQRQDKQPPYYSRRTELNSTTVEYGRSSEQEIFEDRVIANLWKDVKGFAEENTEGFTDRDGDLLLYTFSALIKETDGKGAAWIWANQFLDDRNIKPITKKEGAIERRAGHRTERIAEIERSMYRLSGLWINIEEIRPPRRKGGKTKVFRHKGRVFSVMETWSQETLGEDGKIQEKTPVAWKIRAGDWLMEYLEAPRFVAYLCDQSLKYDPYREQWEKRLSRYFLFFLRINGKHGNNTIVREVKTLIEANSLPIDRDHPQRSKDRFEQAMARLLEDNQIDHWEYVAESVTQRPSKKWLDVWQKWQVRISVRPRPKLIEE